MKLQSTHLNDDSIFSSYFQAIRVFFYLRDLSLTLRQETESHLPLTKQEECVKLGDVLDLSKSGLQTLIYQMSLNRISLTLKH